MRKQRPSASVEVSTRNGKGVSTKSVPVPAQPSRKVPDNPAVVGYSVAMTRPLGAYESVKVSVHLSMPCAPEEVDRVFVESRDWADNKLRDVLDELFDGGGE